MTKGQRRAGTQTLHISSSPISQCTFQDLLGRREGDWGGEAGVQEEKEDRERESYVLPVLCTEEWPFSFSRDSGKKKNK